MWISDICNECPISFVTVIPIDQYPFRMYKSIYFLVFAVFLFTSCKEDEAPQSFLIGTYEIAGQISDTEIFYVSQYIFNSEGGYERISLFREEGLIGYQYYSKGAYTLRGESFSMRETKMAGVNVEEYPDGYVGLLEELEDNGFNPNESKGTLRQIDQGEKIAILMECNDLISFPSMCIGEQVYVRLD